MDRKEFRKTEFFLYNYYNLDNMIKEIQEEIISAINVSGNTWVRGITLYNNTLENQIIRLVEDKRILNIKRWQVLIKKVLVFLYKKYPLYFNVLKLKYFEKRTILEIQEALKIDFKSFKKINYKLVVFVAKNAKLRNLI
ncbi:MAG: hypothetical protein E7313_08205 [Clostridiales bacterium]|nr:hypothetical protein [Clostridiales bacterium]